jgi:hypothetical protein
MAAKLSLLDVLPRHERVDIGGNQKLDVYGISGEDIGRILDRWPDAFAQMAMANSQPTQMDGGLLGALLAAGQRNDDGVSMLGNDKAEARARSLGVADQMNILQAVGRCTFPEGVGPFLELLVLNSTLTEEAIRLSVQVASRVQHTASPPTQKPSEQLNTHPSGS